MEEIVGKIEKRQPRFEMNTALFDFVILLLILRGTIHFSLMEKVPGKWREDLRHAFERINAHAFT